MMRIRVVGRQGVSLDGSQATDFGSAGGTIGRADTNTLVLSDPDRTVSRVHAQILYRNGQFFVVDRGSNPLQCNGAIVGKGQELALGGGERLLMGTFELLVELMADAGLPQAVSALAGAPAIAAVSPFPDDDPFADLLRGLPGAPVASAPGAFSDAQINSAGGPPVPGLPGDDAFADLLAPAVAAEPATPAQDDFSDLGMAGASAPQRAASVIDELIAGGSSGNGMVDADPLGMFASSAPLQPNTNALADDPFASFGQSAPITQDPRPDHAPVEQFGFVPPVIGQVPARAAPAVAAQAVPPQAPVVPPLQQQPLAPAREAQPPVESAVSPQGTNDSAALLAAFLRGVGPLHRSPVELTPALMERIGMVLRSSTEGTLQLLRARQELKREVRAEVTMIGAQANNPLKFSPTADVALAHLLGPRIGGFMPAEPAMQDAYDDLRAHQFGVMVGMRAALTQLIERFGPEQLEQKITAKSALDHLFAAQRKARLWDQFIALYATIAQEAEDDFHALFGKAFAEAYEQQMALLKRNAAQR